MNRNKITGISAKEMERARAIKAMETLARCINNEEIFDSWLTYGVADESINEDTTIAEISGMGYTDSDIFESITYCFMSCMSRAHQSGGLFCGGICAGEEKVDE